MPRLHSIKNFHGLVYLLVLRKDQFPGHDYSLEDWVISWMFFIVTPGETHSRNFIYNLRWNAKENKVNTGTRQKHILGSQASSQEIPKRLAPSSLWGLFFFLFTFFFLLKWKSNVATSWQWKEQHLKIQAAPLMRFPGRVLGCLLLNRRNTQCASRIRLGNLDCTANPHSNLH